MVSKPVTNLWLCMHPALQRPPPFLSDIIPPDENDRKMLAESCYQIKKSYHHFASNYITNLRHIHTNHTPQHKSCLKMRPLNKTPRNKCGALPEGAVAPSLEAACKLIIGPLDGWVDRKKTLFENNIHKIGDNLDDVPPLISLPSHHLIMILQDDFFLVLCFF